MVTPKGFLKSVGEPCSLCRLLRNKIIKNTTKRSSIIAVKTPITTSMYPSPSFRAATKNNLNVN